MAFPDGRIPTENLDAGTDSPSAARADLKEMADQFNELVDGAGQADGVAVLGSNGRLPDAQLGRGVASGVASLNASGKIPEGQIPALVRLNPVVDVRTTGYSGAGDRYVDDVTGQFVDTAAGKQLRLTLNYAQLTGQ